MHEKKDRLRLFNGHTVTLSLLFLALASICYLVDFFYLKNAPAGSFALLLYGYTLLPSLANSMLAALAIFLLFEIAAARAIRGFIKNVLTDDEVFQRLFNRVELKRIIKLASKKMSNSDEFGEASAQVIHSLSKDSNAGTVVSTLSAEYELVDHDLEYYWIDARISYDRHLLEKELLFDAYIPIDKSNQSVHRNSTEFSWMVVTGMAKRSIQPDDFVLSEFLVDGKEWKVSKEKTTKSETIYRCVADPSFELDFSIKRRIEIRFRAKQARKFGFVATTFKYLTFGYAISVDYTNMKNINEVWQVGHVVGDKNPTFDHRRNSPQKAVSQMIGWALPESGVTISWMEQETNN